MNRITTVFCIVFALTLSGCITTSNKSADEKRQTILTMKNETLSDLYKVKPSVKSQIEHASGYAVFSNANIHLIFAGVGAGYGVAKDNQTGKYTYMNMGEVGLGFGAGIKDFRIIFVFHTAESLNRFTKQGWAFGAQADAAAKTNDKGAAVGGEAIIDNVTLYQLTESGLALQATVKGTKYWKDAKLN